jgi:hypothetical protein
MQHGFKIGGVDGHPAAHENSMVISYLFRIANLTFLKGEGSLY